MIGFQGSFKNSRRQNSEHWISMSDLMAGLMMVFLFISVTYMHYIRIERDKIKQFAVTYQKSNIDLYNALLNEFSDDLKKWDAEIDMNTLEFRFNSPDALFLVGSAELKMEFRSILDDFFPRYLNILSKFKFHINDVRIEGHTSSGWSGAPTEDIAYFNNMELSQGRTYTVLRYLYVMPSVSSFRPWIKENFTAVGYSSSNPVINEFGLEDVERSRRVAFKITTNAETQIKKIIQE